MPTRDGVSDFDQSCQRFSTELSRRQLLRTVANAGAGAGVARFLSAGDVLSDPSGEVSVVYGYARDDPADPTTLRPRRRTVPAEWYADLQRAFAAKRALVDAAPREVVGLSVVPGEHGSGSPAPALDVGVTASSARDRVARAIRRVEFDVTEIRELPPYETEDVPPSERPRRVHDSDDPEVSGGVACDGDEFGTLAPALFDGDGTRRFATSNHLYGAQGTKRTDHRGRPLHLLGTDDRVRVGTVRRGYPNEDVVVADPVDGYRPQSRIVGVDRPVVGQFTKVGLADLRARGEELEKVGAVSGRSSGTIRGVDAVTWFMGDVWKDGQIRWGDEFTITDGDSGSVCYHADPDRPDEYVMVAGFNNARTWWPGGDYTWGTAAYHFADVHGYHF